MPRPEPGGAVTILGAGIVGICTALALLERGVQVTLVDRGEPGQETSMGNAGVISPWSIVPQAMPALWKSIPSLLFGYGRPLSIHPRMALSMIPWGLDLLSRGTEAQVRNTSAAMSHLCGPSVDLYRKHLHGTGHEDLIADSLYVHAFRDGSRANLRGLDYLLRIEAGAELEVVGRDGLRRIEPALSPDFNAAVLINGQARARSPGRLGKVLAQKAFSLGAKYVRADIKRARRDISGWKIECDGTTLEAERVVLCLGAWSTSLLKDMGLKIPLMAERGYHVQFRGPGIGINNSVMDVDAKVVFSSMEDGVRIAGQAEFAPIDAPPNRRRERQLVEIAKTALPDLRIDDPSFWMGRRPSLPDSLPVIADVPGMPGLHLNFGHSHYGLMMAPKSGDIMAQLICGEHANIDVKPYSATRF